MISANICILVRSCEKSQKSVVWIVVDVIVKNKLILIRFVVIPMMLSLHVTFLTDLMVTECDSTMMGDGDQQNVKDDGSMIK